MLRFILVYFTALNDILYSDVLYLIVLTLPPIFFPSSHFNLW